MPTLSVSLNYSFPTHRATPCWFYRQQSHCLSAIVLLGNTNHPPLALPFHYHKPPRSIFLSSFFWNVSDRTCARNPKHSTAFMPLTVDTSLSSYNCSGLFPRCVTLASHAAKIRFSKKYTLPKINSLLSCNKATEFLDKGNAASVTRTKLLTSFSASLPSNSGIWFTSE